MDRADNKRYIENKFSDQMTGTLIDHQAEIIRIFSHDFVTFVEKIKPDEIKAIASVPQKTCLGIDCFTGPGSYLALYIRLIGFCEKINKLEETGNDMSKAALEALKEAPEFNKEALIKRAEISLEKLKATVAQAEKENPYDVLISYYFGGPAVYLNGCLLSQIKKDAAGFAANLKSLLAYKDIIVKDKNNQEKELLYGIPGYLYCLLVLQAQNQNVAPDFQANVQKEVRELVEIIVNDGLKPYGQIDIANLPNNFRLKYDFYKTEYLGAAHGLFGVLYILLRAYQLNLEFLTKEAQSLTKILLITVKASYKYVLTLQKPTGNFPAARGDEGAELVQFCHGSPGAIPSLLLATEVFKDDVGENCRKAALLAGGDVWERGIVKKGFGLCHGITGNAYSFLTLYRYTNDNKWLYRAYCFISTKGESYYTDVISKYSMRDRFTVGISDYPYSLMLGLAGDIYMEAETLFPETAK